MDYKIKPEFSGVVIGFKNKSLPIGQRSQEDLNHLYERAKDRENQILLSYFEPVNVSKQESDTRKEKAFTEKQFQKISRKAKERE